MPAERTRSSAASDLTARRALGPHIDLLPPPAAPTLQEPPPQRRARPAPGDSHPPDIPPAPAWEERGFQTSGYKHSAGFELRASLGSYYIFPTAFSFVAAYAIDPTQFLQFAFGGLPIVITQEQGWSYYLTLAFGFEL